MALLGFGNVQAEVSKWADDKGVVHYGDVVPDKYRGNAKAMPPRNAAPSAAQDKEAQLRLQEYTEALRTTSRESEPVTPTPAVDESPARQVKIYDSSCDGQWQQFVDSQDCFAPYRNKNGGVKPEAFSICPVIKMPSCISRNLKPH